MAIIAPHIKAAQVALAEATSQAGDLRTKLEQFNQGNLPTLFVEGPTDYAVFQRLLQVFRPQQAQQVFLAEPPLRAGANYVTNMLRSWEFRTKHLPVLQRRNAVGIIDGDAEGEGAHERFKNEDVSWKHVSLIKLGQPAHLTAACELGITVPICLEELWPSTVWMHAEQQGWLCPRSKKGLIGEKFLQRLTEKDERLSDLIDDAWRPYFERRVNDDEASTAKVAWAAYIAGLPPAQIEPIATEHLKVLDEAIGKLGI